MFFDLFTSLRTRCSPAIRRLGYVDETLAMRHRSRRRRSAWNPHLEKSREFVLFAAQKCAKRDKVAVLGCGLLLDVPLAELSSLFRKVVLTDVVCLPEIRKRIKQYDNVTFIEQDVTNAAAELYRNKSYGIHELPKPAIIAMNDCDDADLVISLNILSQLCVIPRMYAEHELPGLTDDELDEWCKNVVTGHYAYLRSLRNNVCIIADYESVKRDRAGAQFSRNSTVYGLELSRPDDTWIWNIEPIMGKSQFHSKELIVGAWLFLNESRVTGAAG